ncbi:lysophospholipase [Laetiporus sulphureus 93-53]|uniref:Lysophospholipase n=1 Tax=Laetiporus sulphureus 93-53 TaxID=1314785 RepID=A0A165C744_9APHY|nr:lysophospholipase [Laetiporus sulphureus 93-53]KZT02314.1 lysophospholipase [Laetiporus sulphureus 93-53]
MFAVLLALSGLCWLPLYASAQSQASKAYAPVVAPCPSGISVLREAGTTNQSLSEGESAYVSGKRKTVLPAAWKSYLAAVNGSTSDVVSLPSYVSAILNGSFGGSAYPNLSIATSGGGYRAATFGAGVLNALDARNATSVRAGTGGLLQASTYLAGLSGGSWMVTSLAQADFPTLYDLVLGPETTTSSGFNGWLANFSLFDPSDSIVQDTVYIIDLADETDGKAGKGFNVSITDVWARALSRHFANGTTAATFLEKNVTHGAGLTFSSISTLPAFTSHTLPFPIVVTDSISPYQNDSNILNETEVLVPLTNPIYEINAYEMGSFDPVLGAFILTKYLGTTNSTLCVTEYDQVSFIEGLSSSLFNEAVVLENAEISDFIEILSEYLPDGGDIFYGLLPNPFHGLSPNTYIASNQTVLQLVDGGEDGEEIPFTPLLVKAREVDVIVAIDAAADTSYNWADGSSLIATQDRVSYFPGTYAFPPVPTSASTFLSKNLTRYPTFFGCNSSVNSSEPLVIYLANGGPPLGQTPATNTSTLQLSYGAEELEAMLSQTFDIATQGRATESSAGWEKDPEWPACLACAVVDRSRQREGVTRSGVCASCLDRYCWS